MKKKLDMRKNLRYNKSMNNNKSNIWTVTDGENVATVNDSFFSIREKIEGKATIKSVNYIKKLIVISKK